MHLMKTIRMSKNLFSLTDRLPKNKYREKSRDLLRNNSQDSEVLTNGIGFTSPIANSLKVKIDRDNISLGKQFS